ncbi:MAG: DNA-processing protein DprA [Gammaproteobacteria bacterium]|nr:DNA-processing protein DprA [Gammaproteobacteria bacterium]MYD79156.1 DNA-processing protein DprA [Gammaproteobacteria bacterium]
MSLSARSQALVLLTVPLTKIEPDRPKALTIGEWNRFAMWMKHGSLSPEDLFKKSAHDLLIDFNDRTVTPDRVQCLLDQRLALGLALEKWQRMGIWVLTRADPEYPSKLKERFRSNTAPVLFGFGSKSLLKTDGVAVVGSRDASSSDCERAYQFGQLIADQGYSIISGGARGIDTYAANGAQSKEGTVIVVLPNGLSKASTSSKYRDLLMSKNLLLLSPIHPESNFNVGVAMSRNRYIYGLSSAAIVVCSKENGGGTWHGALENIKNNWVPLWVSKTESQPTGNEALVNHGGKWLPDPLQSIDDLFVARVKNQLGLNLELDELDQPSPTKAKPMLHAVGERSLYRAFLEELDRITSQHPMSRDEIKSSLDLTRSQTEDWLRKGVDNGEIKRSIKPVRYQFLQDLFSGTSSDEV